jgi:hypothetical protein
MPWINLTLRRDALPKAVQHAVMAKLTEVLTWSEMVPNTSTARNMMKGWDYEVAEEADCNAGSPEHEVEPSRVCHAARGAGPTTWRHEQKPFYFVETVANPSTMF